MIHLGNYFSPLNISNLFLLLVFVVCCEVVGYRLILFSVKEVPTFLRGTVWLLGLGLIIFFYFLMHLFLPFSSPVFIFILVVLFSLSIRTYIKDKAWEEMFSFLKINKIPLLIILIILPKVIIKSSLPPYLWDEMAYHYISPYTLYFEKSWFIGNSFYQNLPRLLETVYVALFSISKTYSIARVIHFMIFISFLLTAYTYLKKKFGFWTAILYFIATLFFSENFLLWSTLGYVDVGTMSFVMISVISFLDFYLDNKSGQLFFSVAFMGMAIGSKYSALTQLLSLLIITTGILFVRKNVSFFKSRIFISGIVLLFVLGGYWYAKNLVFTGNPIYPFLFGCKFVPCETVSLAYTNPLNIMNAPVIYATMFLNNKFLEIMLPVSILLTFLFGNKESKKLLLFVLVFVTLEILLVRNISGYQDRYFYDWQTLSILILVIPISILSKTEKRINLNSK